MTSVRVAPAPESVDVEIPVSLFRAFAIPTHTVGRDEAEGRPHEQADVRVHAARGAGADAQDARPPPADR